MSNRQNAKPAVTINATTVEQAMSQIRTQVVPAPARQQDSGVMQALNSALLETEQAKPRMMEMARNFGMEDRLFSGMFLRSAFYRHLLDGRKDLDAECGWPPAIMIQQYRAMFDREGIATRVVQCLPQESWAMDPEVSENQDPDETEFEKAWEQQCKKWNFWHFLERVDELSGIGQYGILLIGLDDGNDLSTPVEGVSPTGEKEGNTEYEILFLRVFDESVTMVKTREMDITNPRYGLPTMYTVLFIDLGITGIAQGTDIISKDIHWTRCIHVADNRKMSETYGIPRLQPVYNRICDIRKTLGASAEMFYKGGFPGIVFELNPDQIDQGITPEMDKASIKQEFEDYSEGLQRFMAVGGVTAKSLAPNVADPNGHIQCQMDSIAITLGIPKRILFGSEQAQLASTQDSKTWMKRVQRRQTKYISPMLIRPFIDRLICFGVLPEVEEYFIDWPDLASPSDLEKAQVAGVQTTALAAYVAGGVDQLIPPEKYFTEIMGFSDETAEQLIEDAEEWMEENPDGIQSPAAKAAAAAPAFPGAVSGAPPTGAPKPPGPGGQIGNPKPALPAGLKAGAPKLLPPGAGAKPKFGVRNAKREDSTAYGQTGPGDVDDDDPKPKRTALFAPPALGTSTPPGPYQPATGGIPPYGGNPLEQWGGQEPGKRSSVARKPPTDAAGTSGQRKKAVRASSGGVPPTMPRREKPVEAASAAGGKRANPLAAPTPEPSSIPPGAGVGAPKPYGTMPAPDGIQRWNKDRKPPKGKPNARMGGK